MARNPVISALGRRLRLAVIGGGPGSFIGAMHRQAARLDDRYELVAGVLSSNPERAKKAGLDIGLASERAFTSVPEMLDTEVTRDDGADVVAIMTPNDSHYQYAVAALERGFDVICDKPMTNTLEDAEKLHQKVQDTGLVFCLTHNYTGYPMVRQAHTVASVLNEDHPDVKINSLALARTPFRDRDVCHASTGHFFTFNVDNALLV